MVSQVADSVIEEHGYKHGFVSFDASRRGSEDIGNVKRKVSTCREVMAQEINRVPVLICLNKIDLATHEHLEKVFEETRRVFEHEEIVEISSKTGSNVQELLQKIAVIWELWEAKISLPQGYVPLGLCGQLLPILLVLNYRKSSQLVNSDLEFSSESLQSSILKMYPISDRNPANLILPKRQLDRATTIHNCCRAK